MNADKTSPKWDSAYKVIATSFAAGLVLLVCRYTLLGFQPELRLLVTLVAVGYYDLLFVAVLCFSALLLIAATGKRTGLAILFARVHWGVILLGVLLGLANIEIVWSLGQPLTYSWLAYSDFLMGLDARSAIKSEITGGVIGYASFVLLLFVGARYCFLVFLNKTALVTRMPSLPVFLIIFMGAAYFPLVGIHLSHTDWFPSKVHNAAWTFLRSCVSHNEFVAAQNSRATTGEDPAAQKSTFAVVKDGHKILPPKNVIFFVMESVGAKYLKFCGGDYAVTPTLSIYQNYAVQFQNIFATFPRLTKAWFHCYAVSTRWLHPRG